MQFSLEKSEATGRYFTEICFRAKTPSGLVPFTTHCNRRCGLNCSLVSTAREAIEARAKLPIDPDRRLGEAVCSRGLVRVVAEENPQGYILSFDNKGLKGPLMHTLVIAKKEGHPTIASLTYSKTYRSG